MTASNRKRIEESPEPPSRQPDSQGEEESGKSAGERAPRGPLFTVVGFAVLGLANMLYLTHLHWAVHSIPGFSSFCSISAEIDCDAVAASPYSVLFGVPISFWGVLAYLAIIAVAIWGVRALSPRAADCCHRGAGLGLLSGAAAGSLVFSGVLGYISARFIESFCIMCLLGYLINIAIAISVAVALYHQRKGPFRALRDDLAFLLARPKQTLSIGAGAATVAVLTLLFYPSPEAQAEEGGHDSLDPRIESLLAAGGDPEMESLAVFEQAQYRGPTDAPITIVEFTDYQCPFCRRTYEQKKSLFAAYEGRFRHIHRHYPLDQKCNPAIPQPGNGQSCAAAKHAICAGEQGLFWELNELLFTTENRLTNLEIRRLSRQAGCDMDALDACLESGLPDRILSRDTGDGTKLGIQGTPTFFINGIEVMGMPTEEFLERIFSSDSLARR